VLFVFDINQHAMALVESAALAILAAETHWRALEQ
jgi:hypothetical protein